MSTPNPLPAMEQTAIPTAIAILEAGQTFASTLLTGDPMQIPLKVAPAAAIFLASLQLSLGALLPAEAATVGTAVNADFASLIAKLKAAQKSA